MSAPCIIVQPVDYNTKPRLGRRGPAATITAWRDGPWSATSGVTEPGLTETGASGGSDSHVRSTAGTDKDSRTHGLTEHGHRLKESQNTEPDVVTEW